MKKQHALSFLLVVTIIFSLILTASASEPAVIQIDSFNEYDYIERIQESSPKELEEVGLSVQEAQVIISEFYNALSERAALSDDELHAYGYSDHQIDLLHSFAAGQTLSSSELRSLGATCNGEIVRTYCIGKSARFSYTFTWQSCPIMTLLLCGGLLMMTMGTRLVLNNLPGLYLLSIISVAVVHQSAALLLHIMVFQPINRIWILIP